MKNRRSQYEQDIFVHRTMGTISLFFAFIISIASISIIYPYFAMWQETPQDKKILYSLILIFILLIDILAIRSFIKMMKNK